MRAQICAIVLLAANLAPRLVANSSAQFSGIQTADETTGTLNVVLANKNGFVIAADSRMTNVSDWSIAIIAKSFFELRRIQQW